MSEFEGILHLCSLKHRRMPQKLWNVHTSQILDRALSVEYALRDDDEREGRNDSLRAGYGRCGDSPVYRWAQPSPDYGGPTAQCMTDTMLPHMINPGVLK